MNYPFKCCLNTKFAGKLRITTGTLFRNTTVQMFLRYRYYITWPSHRSYHFPHCSSALQSPSRNCLLLYPPEITLKTIHNDHHTLAKVSTISCREELTLFSSNSCSCSTPRLITMPASCILSLNIITFLHNFITLHCSSSSIGKGLKPGQGSCSE